MFKNAALDQVARQDKGQNRKEGATPGVSHRKQISLSLGHF